MVFSVFKRIFGFSCLLGIIMHFAVLAASGNDEDGRVTPVTSIGGDTPLNVSMAMPIPEFKSEGMSAALKARIRAYRSAIITAVTTGEPLAPLDTSGMTAAQKASARGFMDLLSVTFPNVVSGYTPSGSVAPSMMREGSFAGSFANFRGASVATVSNMAPEDTVSNQLGKNWLGQCKFKARGSQTFDILIATLLGNVAAEADAKKRLELYFKAFEEGYRGIRILAPSVGVFTDTLYVLAGKNSKTLVGVKPSLKGVGYAPGVFEDKESDSVKYFGRYLKQALRKQMQTQGGKLFDLLQKVCAEGKDQQQRYQAHCVLVREVCITIDKVLRDDYFMNIAAPAIRFSNAAQQAVVSGEALSMALQSVIAHTFSCSVFEEGLPPSSGLKHFNPCSSAVVATVENSPPARNYNASAAASFKEL